jgi:general secretion pathway protein J
MIRLTVRDAGTERVLSVSTIAPVHVQVPSDCIRADGKCDDKKDGTGDDKAGAPPSGPGGLQAAAAGQGTTP